MDNEEKKAQLRAKYGKVNKELEELEQPLRKFKQNVRDIERTIERLKGDREILSIAMNSIAIKEPPKTCADCKHAKEFLHYKQTLIHCEGIWNVLEPLNSLDDNIHFVVPTDFCCNQYEGKDNA